MAEPEPPAEPAGKTETSSDGRADVKPVPGLGEDRRRPGGARSHGPTVVAVVALVLSLVALAGVGALAWTWYQLRGEQARVSRIEGRLSDLSGEVAALGAGKADSQSVAALAQGLKDFRHGEDKRLDAMEQNLRQIASRIAGVNIAYREDEAAALMRLAQARLDLAADPAGAARALTLADQSLARADDSALQPVHIALAREIAALKAVPRVDVGGSYVVLESLVNEVKSFPLAGEAVLPAPVPATASAGFSWGGIGAAFKRAFSPLIVVRHGPVARPLLPPKEAYFVRQNVRLALAGAELALMQRNATAWQASLAQARQWLDEWFLSSDPSVNRAKATLNRLAALRLAPKLPTLGAALARLQAVRAQRAAAMAAPTAASQ